MDSQGEVAQGSRRLLLLTGDQGDQQQINEANFRAEVIRIYDSARPETRRIYERGRVAADEPNGRDNWVVR